MAEIPSSEDGITPTVKTFFSRYTVADVIDHICAGKVSAVRRWLSNEGLRPEKCLIIGSYLTGASLANSLATSSSVTVLDIYPHLRRFLDPKVSFTTSIRALDAGGWDFVMDTSGLGGIRPADLPGLGRPDAYLVEDPASDGSDDILRHIDRTRALLKAFPAARAGVLWTDGLSTKTSGTMTLAMGALCRAMGDASREEGVLYSTASMGFYERVLFQEKDPDTFLEALKKPALAVSSLKEIDCNRIVEKNLCAIRSRVKKMPWGGR